MRFRFLPAILWISLLCASLPAMPLAQSQGAGSAQRERPTQQSDPLTPFVQGVIQLFVDEAIRGDDAETQPPNTGGSTNGDDVQVTDRQGPVIQPLQNSFTSKRGRASVVANITDSSGIARAVVVTENTRIQMTANGGRQYTAAVPLPAHYRPVNVGIRAWDRRQNASRTVPVAIRRLPACGKADGVSVRAVTSVQQSLTVLGRYNGGIDGLAGPNTCGAISEEGITGAFDWPVIVKELEWRAAVSQVSLSVVAPDEATGDVTPIRVRVIDPRNSGAVAWVEMRVDGANVTRQQNTGTELRFDVSVAEGATRKITFLALSRRADAALATRDVILSRPGPITLFLSGSGLIGDRLKSDEPEVAVMARVEGSRKARVFFHNRSKGQRGVLGFFGTPVAMPVIMPDAGEQGHVVFWAEDGNRTTPPRRIELARVLLPGPDLLALAPVPPPTLTDDVAPLWISEVSVPGRGVSPSPLPTLVVDTTPDPIVSPPPAPTPPTPEWWLPVGIGIVVLIGLVAAIARFFRRGVPRPDPVLPMGAPAIRVKAHPDTAPTADVTGLDLPGLVLTVDPDAEPAVMMVFETDLERMAQ